MAVPFICSVCWLQWSSDVNDQTKRSAQNGKTLQWFYTTQMKCYMKQCNENTTIENNEIWDERSWRGRSWAQKNAFFKIGIPFFSARSRGRTGCAAKNNHIQSIGTSIGWLNIFDTIFQEIHLATQVERKQWRKRLSLSLSRTHAKQKSPDASLLCKVHYRINRTIYQIDCGKIARQKRKKEQQRLNRQ